MHIFKKLHDVITIIFTPNFEQFFISFNSTQHFVLSLRKGDIILMSCKSINKNKSWRPIRQLEIVLRFLSPSKLNKWFSVERFNAPTKNFWIDSETQNTKISCSLLSLCTALKSSPIALRGVLRGVLLGVSPVVYHRLKQVPR